MRKFFLIAVILAANIAAEDNVRFGFENGFGARAFSMANNYVALSNDLSAIYWNPAAMSFSLTREFQVTLICLHSAEHPPFQITCSPQV